jgi:hypothetical protein
MWGFLRSPRGCFSSRIALFVTLISAGFYHWFLADGCCKARVFPFLFPRRMYSSQARPVECHCSGPRAIICHIRCWQCYLFGVPKRISRKRSDEIRAEVFEKADRPNDPTIDDRVMKRLKCGHEDMVSPGVNDRYVDGNSEPTWQR